MDKIAPPRGYKERTTNIIFVSTSSFRFSAELVFGVCATTFANKNVPHTIVLHTGLTGALLFFLLVELFYLVHVHQSAMW